MGDGVSLAMDGRRIADIRKRRVKSKTVKEYKSVRVKEQRVCGV